MNILLHLDISILLVKSFNTLASENMHFKTMLLIQQPDFGIVKWGFQLKAGIIGFNVHMIFLLD